MKTEEIAWAAGLLEGEGYFGAGDRRYPYISIEMTDKDVLKKLRQVFPFGEIKTIDNTRKNGIESYRMYLSSQEKVKDIIKKIRPWMGTRRKQRMDELIQMYDKYKDNCQSG